MEISRADRESDVRIIIKPYQKTEHWPIIAQYA